MSGPVKKRFYTIARSSVYECVAILDIVSEVGEIDENSRKEFYRSYEEVSKMLLAMYRSLNK